MILHELWRRFCFILDARNSARVGARERCTSSIHSPSVVGVCKEFIWTSVDLNVQLVQKPLHKAQLRAKRFHTEVIVAPLCTQCIFG